MDRRRCRGRSAGSIPFPTGDRSSTCRMTRTIYSVWVLTNRSAPHARVTPVLTVADVRAAVERAGTLAGAIDLLQRPERTLKELTEVPQVPEAVLNVASVADPERPVEFNDLLKVFNTDVAAAESGPAWGKIALASVRFSGSWRCGNSLRYRICWYRRV